MENSFALLVVILQANGFNLRFTDLFFLAMMARKGFADRFRSRPELSRALAFRARLLACNCHDATEPCQKRITRARESSVIRASGFDFTELTFLVPRVVAASNVLVLLGCGRRKGKGQFRVVQMLVDDGESFSHESGITFLLGWRRNCSRRP